MSYQKGTAIDNNDLFQQLRTFLKAGANATGVLTLSGNAANTETVVIDGKTYTFQTSLTNVDGHVLIGVDAATSIANLAAALGLWSGAGTLYAAATTAHASAYPAGYSATALTVQALTPGTGGNSLATTETMGSGAWGASTMAGGGVNAWTENRYDSVNLMSNFTAPGISGSDVINFGFGVVSDIPNDQYALTGWMFKVYNSALGYQNQPGQSAVRFHPVWNSTTPYWFVGNGQHVSILTKVSTVYSASYVGKFLPYGTPGEYPQPYIVNMPDSANTRWSVNSFSIRNCFDPGPNLQILHSDGVWYAGGNQQNSGGTETALVSSACFVWPYASQITDSTDQTRYRELRDNVDGSYTLWPTRLLCDTPANDQLGEMDGVYAVSGFNQASEDIIPINGIANVVIQDIARTARSNYGAFALV